MNEIMMGVPVNQITKANILKTKRGEILSKKLKTEETKGTVNQITMETHAN